MHGNEKISLIDAGGNVEHNREGRAAKGSINENGSSRRGENGFCGCCYVASELTKREANCKIRVWKAVRFKLCIRQK